LLKPASGEPLVAPRLDIVFGIFYLTNESKGVKGEGKAFASVKDVELAYQRGEVHPQAKIHLRVAEGRIETTAGRAMLNAVLPEGHAFVNEALDTKKVKVLIRDIYKHFGREATAKLADDLMQLGFKFSEYSGMTMSIFDVNVPKEKDALIKQGEEAIEEIAKRYRKGLITPNERRKLSIEKWTEIRNKVEKAVKDNFDRNSSIWTMVTSGARGSANQLTQLAGMKGLVVNPAGEIIEVPIVSNYKEGLSVLEYFISTHGSRKGKSDTSLKTADAGYLTRRLVDVAQDVVVTIPDCGTKEGTMIFKGQSEEFGETYEDRLIGRVVIDAVKDSAGKVAIKTGQEITEDNIAVIIDNKIDQIKVRSVVHCHAPWGVCQNCYGRDLSTGRIVEVGVAVGIIAAQAIGEPGTQLTMKTFHSGGVFHGGDVTSGLPRVEEVFEARPPHNPAIIAEIDGTVMVYEQKDKQYVEILSKETPVEEFELTEGYQPSVKDKDIVKAKQAVATATDKKAMRTTIAGRANIKGNKIVITSLEPMKVSYAISGEQSLKVKNGDQVAKGDRVTEGHIDLSMSLELCGLGATQEYIVREVQAIYASHGAAVNEKHIEIIARAMFSKVRVIEGGDSTLLGGQVVDKLEVDQLNEILTKSKKRPVSYELIVLGVTRASLNTNSFLSAASFQETTSILIKAAIQGAVDPLRGLKENVIIGKLIPAGTGYAQSLLGQAVDSAETSE
jgi:DNA-directed RNA polymerase subunit beta'